MKKIAAAMVAACMLTGCSYNLSLMARNSTETGIGTATRPGNDVTIEAGGVKYVGKFTYQEGGFVGVGSNFTGGTAAMYGASGQAAGNILARSSDGKGMRCQFSFSGWSQSGMGACQDDSGLIYDLQITK